MANSETLATSCTHDTRRRQEKRLNKIKINKLYHNTVN